MKKTTIELIEKTFKKQFDDISMEIRLNKRKIKELSRVQKELKDTRKGLFEILSQIRGYK